MKPLLLSTIDNRGGAARSAYRLHQGLQQRAIASQMLVQKKLTDDATVLGAVGSVAKGLSLLRPTLDALPLRIYPQREPVTFSCDWVPDTLASQIANICPDLINLHWVGDGLLQIETLAKLSKPLVWTLHDMWAFTGGCHYSQECDRYTQRCGTCPILHSTRNYDLSRWNWQRKVKTYKKLHLTVVTPSRWLAACAKASSLFHDLPIQVIPYGIDVSLYKPIDRSFARTRLNLPLDKPLILFGAINATSDRRKGFHLLTPALHYLSHMNLHTLPELLVIGASQPDEASNLGLKTHYLGNLNDDISLSLVYAAADLFIAPSIQDNLPNTVLEALACGTPCVAFNLGGMPDLIEHQRNGYLAEPFQPEALAQGITWILADSDRYQTLASHARNKVEQEFTLALQAKRYIDLFEQIVLNKQ